MVCGALAIVCFALGLVGRLMAEAAPRWTEAALYVGAVLLFASLAIGLVNNQRG